MNERTPEEEKAFDDGDAAGRLAQCDAIDCPFEHGWDASLRTAWLDGFWKGRSDAGLANPIQRIPPMLL